MTPRLRPATEADHAFLWRLHCEAMRTYVEATWGWDEADQRRRFDATFEPERVSIVVVRDEPVGMLQVERRSDEVVLVAVEVLPEWQGQGIGTRVVSRVVEEAGGVPVSLQVLKVNPARALYERLGFVTDGETATHVTMRRPVR
jgi:ribosomal protein S18 acetylase RimI-like enzyme